LLDTSALLLAVLESPRFSSSARRATSQGDRFISQVAAIEIAIKTSIGRLALPEPFEVDFASAFLLAVRSLEATILTIETEDVSRLARLPVHHRDPFDRLMIAQAIGADLTLVTSDRTLARYEGLKVLEI
ncbi:MAG: type II toxin-antitoxin system VapC family toxin, partial [Caulobacteraceae bacterium]